MTIYEKFESWAETSKKKHRKIFSELNTLLRSLDRAFSIENLPVSKEDFATKNFYDELTVVRDVIFRILGILEVIIPESKKNAYWFQRFTESKFLNDRSRDLFKEGLYRQDTIEKGLLLLYDSFINFKGIVGDLLRTQKISYLSYKNIGQLISKEIRENIFFSPFKKDTDFEYDRVDNSEITSIVRSINDRELRRYISVIYFYLFRFLRYLSHIDITSQYSVSLHSSLMILMMLRSEMTMFHNYLKKTSDRIENNELKILLKSISYQFSMELKRVYLQEMKDILRKKSPQQFRGTIENGQGILKNLIEHSVVQLSQFFKPEIQGEEIFESFTTKLYQSMRLRENIFVLLKFITIIGSKSSKSGDWARILESTKNFMYYFESSIFKLLRYDDYEEFSTFFRDILSSDGKKTDKFLEKIHKFKIFLETTLQNINNRAELKDKPLDQQRAEELFKNYA